MRFGCFSELPKLRRQLGEVWLGGRSYRSECMRVFSGSRGGGKVLRCIGGVAKGNSAG